MSFTYKSAKIPLWTVALLSVMITWIVILFMASFRIYQRQRNNIHEDVKLYFGSKSVKAHHVAMLVTYFMVVGLGLYCYYFLLESTAFLTCVCLPLILLLLLKF